MARDIFSWNAGVDYSQLIVVRWMFILVKNLSQIDGHFILSWLKVSTSMEQYRNT